MTSFTSSGNDFKSLRDEPIQTKLLGESASTRLLCLIWHISVNLSIDEGRFIRSLCASEILSAHSWADLQLLPCPASAFASAPVVDRARSEIVPRVGPLRNGFRSWPSTVGREQ